MAAMECLMAAESIRGFAEALALAEVLVEAVAAAEADLVIGSRFKLAFNCRKELILCQEEMVQGLPARVPAQAGVWGEPKDRAEVEWVDRSPQDREEIAYARNVATRFLML